MHSCSEVDGEIGPTMAGVGSHKNGGEVEERSSCGRDGGAKRRPRDFYQRPDLRGWCILAGETDEGGLDMVRPFAGLMMGMALRVRVAAGWWSFMLDW